MSGDLSMALRYSNRGC